MPRLAAEVLATYEDGDRTRFLDNLFRLQILTGKYSEAEASLAELRRQCASALLAFDSVRADAVLTQALSLYPLETVCLELLETMLVEAGHGWSDGSVSIAQEHALSAFVRSKVASFYGAAITSLFIVLPLLPASYAVVLNFEPIAVLFLGWAILGQSISPLQLAGAALVIGAITLTAIRGARR